MSYYLPQDPLTLTLVLVTLAVTLLAGYRWQFLPSIAIARAAAWGLLLSETIFIERLTHAESPGVRMFAVAAALMFGLKVVVGVESVADEKPHLRLFPWLGFGALWFGMRPHLFEDVPGAPREGYHTLIWLGIRRILQGLGLLLAARWVWLHHAFIRAEDPRYLLATALLLSGLCFVLNFGILNILAGAWRRVGANTSSLFRAPLYSTSLTEFWTQRWNIAFSEMATLGVYRPLRRIIPRNWAMTTAFLFSGLLHELAISLPVHAGYGLPMLYFVIQAIAMSLEKRLQRAGYRVDYYLGLGLLWTAAWIVIPLPLLFHRPFLRGCLWPMLNLP